MRERECVCVSYAHHYVLHAWCQPLAQCSILPERSCSLCTHVLPVHAKCVCNLSLLARVVCPRRSGVVTHL